MISPEKLKIGDRVDGHEKGIMRVINKGKTSYGYTTIQYKTAFGIIEITYWPHERVEIIN